MIALVLAALATSATPCQLDQTKPVEIVLIGENHHSYAARQIRALAVRRAARGEVAFLTETTNRGALLSTDPVAGPALVGLESTLGLSVLISYEIRDPKDAAEVARAVSLLKTYLPRSPLLLEAADGREPADAADVNRITAAVFRLAGTSYAGQLDGEPWPDVAYRPGSPDYARLHRRLMDLRDRDFQRAAARGLCALALSHRRIFINVGDAHAPPMRRYVEDTFGPAVDVHYFDPETARRALDLLRE